MRRVLNRGEAVNALKRAIYTDRISPAQGKRVDEMHAVADALSLLVNIVMAWNTAQISATGVCRAKVQSGRSGSAQPRILLVNGAVRIIVHPAR